MGGNARGRETQLCNCNYCIHEKRRKTSSGCAVLVLGWLRLKRPTKPLLRHHRLRLTRLVSFERASAAEKGSPSAVARAVSAPWLFNTAPVTKLLCNCDSSPAELSFPRAHPPLCALSSALPCLLLCLPVSSHSSAVSLAVDRDSCFLSPLGSRSLRGEKSPCDHRDTTTRSSPDRRKSMPLKLVLELFGHPLRVSCRNGEERAKVVVYFQIAWPPVAVLNTISGEQSYNETRGLYSLQSGPRGPRVSSVG